jgi:imidazoleglycerol phosphate synthase glutamine amidotransferase subunit HisH
MSKLITFSFLLMLTVPLLAQSLMEEREEKARQNRLEALRADEVIEEEEAQEEVPGLGINPVNPYTRIDPRHKKNLFEEMLETQSTARPRL